MIPQIILTSVATVALVARVGYLSAPEGPSPEQIRRINQEVERNTREHEKNLAETEANRKLNEDAEQRRQQIKKVIITPHVMRGVDGELEDTVDQRSTSGIGAPIKSNSSPTTTTSTSKDQPTQQPKSVPQNSGIDVIIE